MHTGLIPEVLGEEEDNRHEADTEHHLIARQAQSDARHARALDEAAGKALLAQYGIDGAEDGAS